MSMLSARCDELRDATHGTLTAEQVRSAIFNGSSYASYDGAKYYADGIHMQAIADELNATITSRAERTCADVAEECNQWKCSECGAEAVLYDVEMYSLLRIGRDWFSPRWCPWCGARAVD